MHLMKKKTKRSRSRRRFKSSRRQLKKFASASRFSIKSSFLHSLGIWLRRVFAPRQLSTSRAEEKLGGNPKWYSKTEKKTYTESREKSRSRLLPQTAVARDLCAIFGLCCTLHTAQTGQTFVANTHAHSLIIANSIAVKYFAKTAKFDIHQTFLFSSY